MVRNAGAIACFSLLGAFSALGNRFGPCNFLAVCSSSSLVTLSRGESKVTGEV